MVTLDEYRWLFRRAPTMATSVGEDGCYLDVNDALLKRLGYEHREMIGSRPAAFMTSETVVRMEQELLPALRRTGRLENKPVSYIASDGEVVNCLVNSLVEHSADGIFIRTVDMYTEISDQARADWKYRQLYRSTPAMLHTVDANALVITVTEHWLQKMGYARKEVVGKSILDFYTEIDRKRFGKEGARDLISNGDFNNKSRQMVTKDGKVLDLLMSAIAERDAAGNVSRLLVASKDVTERLRAERALRDALSENAVLRKELERERDYLREEVNVAMNFGRIIGRSPALKNMLVRIEAVAKTQANVLILGESGVGKELVARAIHSQSKRSEAPLVKVNCASIPKELFESEFFGHVKGAFTGAHRDRVGRVQLADGGTIFLDEVGEIPLELQGKLLRVLQESEFERVGDDRTRSVDVRVIAATNRDLEQLVTDGKFREDVFYRLSVFPIDVPPLRKRVGDVLQLAQHFLEQTCSEFGRKTLNLTRKQAAVIEAYEWPGNVRELKNVIERAVILSEGKTLRLDIPMSRGDGRAADKIPLPDKVGHVLVETQMREFQKQNVLKALKQTGWRVSGARGAAELLGIRPTTLADRIKSFGLKRPRS